MLLSLSENNKEDDISVKIEKTAEPVKEAVNWRHKRKKQKKS